MGHISKDCGNRLTCEVCDKQHPTVLHIWRTNVESEQSSGPLRVKQSTTSQKCGHTGAGKDSCILSIVPVKVKSTKGNNVIQTYVFLDPGSSATFCSEELMERLSITGKITHFLLKTMGQEKVVPAYSVHGLEVSGLEENNFYLLPEVLTQKKMPVTTDNIATAADVKRWPHLSKVYIPSLKLQMLIGTNAPKLLEPWEIVNSCGGGPYGIRTVLGWVINGPLNGNGNSVNMELPSVVVNRISVSNLELMLNNQYNHDFNEKTSENKEMSREDCRFMEIMDSSATLQEERYWLKLHHKKPEILLPNNFAVAKQRILGLQRKFVNSPTLHKEYSSYLNKQRLTKVMQSKYLRSSCGVEVVKCGTSHTTVSTIPERALCELCLIVELPTKEHH